MNTSDHLRQTLTTLQQTITARKDDIAHARSRLDELERHKRQTQELIDRSTREVATLEQQVRDMQRDIDAAVNAERALAA